MYRSGTPIAAGVLAAYLLVLTAQTRDMSWLALAAIAAVAGFMIWRAYRGMRHVYLQGDTFLVEHSPELIPLALSSVEEVVIRGGGGRRGTQLRACLSIRQPNPAGTEVCFLPAQFFNAWSQDWLVDDLTERMTAAVAHPENLPPVRRGP